MGGKHLTIYPGKDTNKFILNGDTVSGKNSEVVSLTQDIGDFARTLNETFGVEQKNQVIEAVESFNKFTKDFSIIIKKANINHSFVIDSTKTDCDVELFIQFIHKQIPIDGAFSKTDISYNEQQLKAIANYETFHGLESGSSNIIDVIESSAGIDGWSK